MSHTIFKFKSYLSNLDNKNFFFFFFLIEDRFYYHVMFRSNAPPNGSFTLFKFVRECVCVCVGFHLVRSIWLRPATYHMAVGFSFKKKKYKKNDSIDHCVSKPPHQIQMFIYSRSDYFIFPFNSAHERARHTDWRNQARKVRARKKVRKFATRVIVLESSAERGFAQMHHQA